MMSEVTVESGELRPNRSRRRDFPPSRLAQRQVIWLSGPVSAGWKMKRASVGSQVPSVTPFYSVGTAAIVLWILLNPTVPTAQSFSSVAFISRALEKNHRAALPSRAGTRRPLERTSLLLSSREEDEVLYRERSAPRAEEQDENDSDPVFRAAVLPDDYAEQPLQRRDLEALTVPQLKQQLRLRGCPVSGRKVDLIERLIQHTAQTIKATVLWTGPEDSIDSAPEPTTPKETKSTPTSPTAAPPEFIDVTAYLDDEDKGKEFKSTKMGSSYDEDDLAADPSSSRRKKEDGGDDDSNSPEVWGREARIVDDYQGRHVVVDGLARTVVEFTGSNQTQVRAYVVASRDALQPYLAGGAAQRTPAEERLADIQRRREQATKRPVRPEDEVGLDEGDETGIFQDVLHRDVSDWGKYSMTGAQLSAAEVQGVLLLSDVYGAFTDDTKILAEKIAFECQPVVVMVPDLFRGQPWTGPTDQVNAAGQTYEQWRGMHPDQRIHVDIRAAAACLRERYGVSAVVLWGTCFGGGRALEAASGWLPEDNIHDVDGSVGPPYVDPLVVVAWYPTRYRAKDLFGKHHKGTMTTFSGEKRLLAVMCIFAGQDVIPGATPDDAAELKKLLEADERVKDHLLKIFPDKDHGFAHIGISVPVEEDDFARFVDDEFGGAGRIEVGDGDANVACLLSTAFMETYSRVFLPTMGPPISLDDQEQQWGKELLVTPEHISKSRNIRKEIEDALNNFVEEPLGGIRVDPSDEADEEELTRLLRMMQDPDTPDGPFKIKPDDDLTTIYGKLVASDENFQIF